MASCDPVPCIGIHKLIQKTWRKVSWSDETETENCCKILSLGENDHSASR